MKKIALVPGTDRTAVDLAAVTGGMNTPLVENKEGGSVGFTVGDLLDRLKGITEKTTPSGDK